MSASLATVAPPTYPDPPQDRAAGGADSPLRSGRLRGLIRRLIDFGKELVGVLQNTPSPAQAFDITYRFGTANIAVIIARITRGLRLAGALDDRVTRSAASLDKIPAAAAASPLGGSRPSRPPARAPGRRDDDECSQSHRLPTAKEIAAQVRRRPIGAVLADICIDLGILPCDPLWAELHDAVDCNGGDFLRVMKGMLRRVGLPFDVPGDTPLIPPMPEGWRSGSSAPAQPATGPP